jgi:hypothetical protein
VLELARKLDMYGDGELTRVPNYQVFKLYQVFEAFDLQKLSKILIVYSILDYTYKRKRYAYLHRVASFGLYYYTRHVFSDMTEEVAKQKVRDLVTTNRWGDITSPGILNALYCVVSRWCKVGINIQSVMMIYWYINIVIASGKLLRLVILLGIIKLYGREVERDDLWVLLSVINLVLWTNEMLCVWFCVLLVVYHRYVGNIIRDVVFFYSNYNDIETMIEYTTNNKVSSK